jgi:hypothetical protein
MQKAWSDGCEFYWINRSLAYEFKKTESNLFHLILERKVASPTWGDRRTYMEANIHVNGRRFTPSDGMFCIVYDDHSLDLLSSKLSVASAWMPCNTDTCEEVRRNLSGLGTIASHQF